MQIGYTVVTTTAEAPVVIDCPACASAGVSSTATETIELVKLLGLIPILKLRNTWVECSHCRKTCVSSARLERLSGALPAEVAPFLRYRPSMAAKLLSILALLSSIVPGLGLVVAGVSMFVGRGTRGWPAMLNVLSMILACTVTVSVVVLLVISH